MDILIIGGSNYIGWNLLKILAKSKNNIITVINRGNKKRQYPSNILHYVSDRNNKSKLANFFKDKNYDIVYDMCSFNKVDSKQIIDLLQNKVKHFIHISSAAVYLESEILPIKEFFPTGAHPAWKEYGKNKLEAEKILIAAHQKNNFPVTIIRPSYVYGNDNPIPREAFLFKRIIDNRPVLLPNDGKAIIQLGHVHDLAILLSEIHQFSESIGKTYNVSYPEYITLEKLVLIAAEICKKEVKIMNVDTKKNNIAHRDIFPFDNETYFIDITAAQVDLNYFPEIDIYKGLRKSYEEFMNSSDYKPNYKLEDELMGQ